MKTNKVVFENFRNFMEHGEFKCSIDGKDTIIYAHITENKRKIFLDKVIYLFYNPINLF